jgi:hypothetical protein
MSELPIAECAGCKHGAQLEPCVCRAMELSSQASVLCLTQDYMYVQ